MASVWRWSVRILGLLVAVVVALVVYLTQLLDPNEYRSDIEQLATEQGVPLRLDGDLKWAFWPRLGLNVEQVSIGQSEHPLLKASAVSASVAIAPLWQRQLVIESVAFDGVTVNLHRDAQGRTNWELAEVHGDIGQPTVEDSRVPVDPASPSSATDTDSTMSLKVAQISLTQLSLHYADRVNDQEFELQGMELSVQDLDLSGQPFRWQQTGQVLLPSQPPLGVSSQGVATFDSVTQQLRLREMTANVSVNQAVLEMTLQGKADLEQVQLDLTAGVTPLNLQQWLTQWKIDLPPMAAADALSRVGGSAKISGTPAALKLDDISLVIDQSQWLGHAAVTESGAITAVLNADQLDLDRYLPMDEPSTEVTAGEQPQPRKSSKAGKSGKSGGAERVVPALSSETLVLEGLRNTDVALSLGIDQLVAKGMTFDDLVLRARLRNDILNITRLTVQQGEGGLSVSGQLNARRDSAKVSLNSELQQIAINPLLLALAAESRLEGKVSGKLNLETTGKSLRAWQRNAKGTLQMTTDALTVKTLDIERSACELAALVNQKSVPAIDWKGQTEFEQLATQLNINGEVLNFATVNAEVENLRVGSKGSFDLRNGHFDFPMDVAFVGEADRERDCQVRDRWRNRDLPLRCEGRLATVSARSCLPDQDRLDDLLRDEVKVKAQDKLKQKLQDKLGDEGSEVVDQLLDRLFKR